MATRDARDARNSTVGSSRGARPVRRDTIISERPTSGDPVQSTWSLGRSPAFARWAHEIRTQARDLIQQRDASARIALSGGTAPRAGWGAGATPEGTTTFHDILPYAVEGQGPSAWTFERLFASCSLKGILCDFASDPAAPRGVLVRQGALTLIRLRADLAPGERIAALAHALGHIYYQHPARVCDPGAADAHDRRTRQEERMADLWAAQCLVLPGVCSAVGARDTRSENVAIEAAARQLAIPPWVVRLWLSAPESARGEAPREWLSHP